MGGCLRVSVTSELVLPSSCSVPGVSWGDPASLKIGRVGLWHAVASGSPGGPPVAVLGSKGPALGRFLARASLRGRRAGPDSRSLRLTGILPGILRLGARCRGAGMPWAGTLQGLQRLFLRSAFPPGEAWPGREPQSSAEAFPPGSTEASPALGSAWSSQRFCWAVVGSIVHPEEGTCALVLEALAPPPPAGCFGLTGWGPWCPALLQASGGRRDVLSRWAGGLGLLRQGSRDSGPWGLVDAGVGGTEARAALGDWSPGGPGQAGARQALCSEGWELVCRPG